MARINRRVQRLYDITTEQNTPAGTQVRERFYDAASNPIREEVRFNDALRVGPPLYATGRDPRAATYAITGSAGSNR